MLGVPSTQLLIENNDSSQTLIESKRRYQSLDPSCEGLQDFATTIDHSKLRKNSIEDLNRAPLRRLLKERRLNKKRGEYFGSSVTQQRSQSVRKVPHTSN